MLPPFLYVYGGDVSGDLIRLYGSVFGGDVSGDLIRLYGSVFGGDVSGDLIRPWAVCSAVLYPAI